MASNKKPWQTIVNNNNVVRIIATANPLVAVKKPVVKNTEMYPVIKLSAPRRYSFDDNGGGYLGL